MYERECIGGQITRAPQVETTLVPEGYPSAKLGDRMAAQAEAAVPYKPHGCTKDSKKKLRDFFRLDTDDGEYYAKAVIYTCGARR